MKIRTRLLLVFVLFVFSALLGFMYLIAEEIRPRYLEAQEEALVDFSEMLAALVSTTAVVANDDGEFTIETGNLAIAFAALPQRPLNAKIYDLDKTQVDIRVYITNSAGTVIFDSDNDRDLGKDYSTWRDVRKTLNGEYGARTSSADPFYPESDTMYIARPILYNGDIIGVLSVGKPTRNADTFISDLTNKLWITGTVLAVISTLVGIMINLWLTKPLDTLQSYALSVSHGERTTLPDIGNNEVGDVGRALQSMRNALDGKSYIEEYIHSFTHEIKAPVAGIRGASELLKEPLPEAQQHKFLTNIIGQTERIQNILDRLLDLSELENTQVLKNQEEVLIKDLLQRVEQSQSDFANTHGVKLVVSADNCISKGDAFLLEQAITNLVKNAIEHANEGSSVSISAQYSNASVQIEVTNSGPTIPDYSLPRIFDRFYSLPKKNGQKSSGIGLSFVREIVKLHNGTVGVTSSNGLTAFTIELEGTEITKK